MSYENTYAYLDLNTDFRGMRIDQLRWGTEPDGTEVLLCTEHEPDFHILREALGLEMNALPVINVPFYKLEYIKNYYQNLTQDQPVQDMPEMEYDSEAQNHIVNKAITVIPFKDSWSGGTPALWKDRLNKEAKFGDFSLMFFAKDAKQHFNDDYGFDDEVKQHWIKTTLEFANERPDKVAIVFCGIY